MATVFVQPRPTPEEHSEVPVQVTLDEDLTVFAATIEDWIALRQNWEFALYEGHDFGRRNNVEVVVVFVSGEQTSTLRFRLDQVDAVDDVGEQLVIRFEEREGIAKIARVTATGLALDLFHILTFT